MGELTPIALVDQGGFNLTIILIPLVALGIHMFLSAESSNDDDDSTPGGGLMQPVA